MSDPSPSTALDVRREAASVGVPLPPMDDGELASLWRTAKGLAESGLFKDAQQAGQAFAKILAGRDLGLTPFESMASLHVVEGKIEASSDLHATRVRERPGFGFRVAWLRVTGAPAAEGAPPQVEAVWADEEALDDLRPTYGCAIVFYEQVPEGGQPQDGKQSGVSRFTLDDAQTARLVKDRGAWQTFPRNMLYARAMTNGVAWFVPEVMGGVRVYGAGELSSGLGGEDLTAAPEGAAEAVVVVDHLPTAVEAVIARARELGHVGLQNRQAAAMAIGPDGRHAATWIKSATVQLNRMAAGMKPEEPVDAEVVDTPNRDALVAMLPEDVRASKHVAGVLDALAEQGRPITPETVDEVAGMIRYCEQQEAAQTPAEAQTPDPTPEAAGAAEDAPAAPEAVDPVEAALEAGADETVAMARGEDSGAWSLEDRIESCRASLRQADDDGDREQFAALTDELNALEAERDAQQNPDQSTLGL